MVSCHGERRRGGKKSKFPCENLSQLGKRKKNQKEKHKTSIPLLPALDILCKVGESGMRDHLKNTHYAIYVQKCGCVKV